MNDRYLRGVLTVIAALLAVLVGKSFIGPPERVVVVEPVFLFRGNDRDPLVVELQRDHRPLDIKTGRGDAVATTPYEPPARYPEFKFPLSRP